MLKSAAARFLDRTETVRVRIPVAPVDPDDPDFDPDVRDAFAAHDAAREAKQAAESKWAQAKAVKRKLSDPELVEPDWDALDAAVEEASAALDPHSIVVVLEYRADEYAKANAWARNDESKPSIYDLKLDIARRLFKHVEVMVSEGWEPTEITWDQVRAQATDGEKGVIADAAWDLCVATGDAAPFKKRGKRSAAT